MVTDRQHGGYDMDDNEIGIFLSIAAIFQVLYQVNYIASILHFCHLHHYNDYGLESG